mmetsp:Transcript_24503/g.24093  ORF Transcript_24503/g.24093 Transcript_24503/m.24093 type:complete len:106 (+) Transcript_24503:394-711(+)
MVQKVEAAVVEGVHFAHLACEVLLPFLAFLVPRVEVGSHLFDFSHLQALLIPVLILGGIVPWLREVKVVFIFLFFDDPGVVFGQAGAFFSFQVLDPLAASAAREI